MDVFPDTKSGFVFCIKVDTPLAEQVKKSGLPHYDLIKWCEQFVSANGVFIDIGAGSGPYSIIISKQCKEVWSFEASKKTFDCLCIGTSLNNRFNIKYHNVSLSDHEGSGVLYHLDNSISTLNSVIGNHETSQVEPVELRTLDSYCLKDVEFMAVNTDGHELEVIKGASMTLFDNNFPPIIFQVIDNKEYKEDLLGYIKSLGYKICPISGYNTMFLAADHPFRKSKEEKTEEIPEVPMYDIDLAVKEYESGELQANPSVPWEVWHALSRHYRDTSKHKQSYDCITHGLAIPPPDDKLYLFYEELSIIAYYLDKKAEGYDACDKVVLSSHSPWNVKNYTLNNQTFYMRRLPFKKIHTVDYVLPPDYIASSSSLIRDGDHLLMNLRSVNYSINDKGGYIIRDPQEYVRTRNFLLELKEDTFDVIKSVEIKDTSGIPLYPKNILGIEDTRLINDHEFFCTYLEVNESRIPQICYCQYDKESGKVNKILPLQVGDKLQCEKNWMPFIKKNMGCSSDGTTIKVEPHDENLYFIYSMDPFRIYHVNRETGSVTETINTSITSEYLGGFRGGSCLIPYKNGWLTTIHQVYHADPRKYFHRFIWFDQDFITVKYSEIFYFEKPQIEFNLSICHSPDGLLVPYSVKDNCSKIGVLNYEILDSWLKL